MGKKNFIIFSLSHGYSYLRMNIELNHYELANF